MDQMVKPHAQAVFLPPGSEEELKLYWRTYDRHKDSIDTELQDLASSHPEYAELLTRSSLSDVQRQTDTSRRLQDRAVSSNEWERLRSLFESYGTRYALADVSVGAWFSVFAGFRRAMSGHILEDYSPDLEKVVAARNGMDAFLDFTVAALGDGYVRTKEQVILNQQEEIRGLSTPVLELEKRLLLLPLVGALTEQRAQVVTGELLSTIWGRHARAAVVDVTGVVGIDSTIVSHLLHAVEAARCMGALIILTGISSDAVRSIVGSGKNIAGLRTSVDLQGGVEEARRHLQTVRA